MESQNLQRLKTSQQFKEDRPKSQALAHEAEKKARKHDDRMAVIYPEKVNLMYQIL